MRACLAILFALAFVASPRAQELFQGAGDVNPNEVDRVYVKGLQFLAKVVEVHSPPVVYGDLDPASADYLAHSRVRVMRFRRIRYRLV